MRFLNNFFSMLKARLFSCGLVCSAAHLNSHGGNRNSIFQVRELKRSLDQPSASSTFWPSCLELCPAGSSKPRRMESAQLTWATCANTWLLSRWSFFPLNQNIPVWLLPLILLPCTSVESFAPFSWSSQVLEGSSWVPLQAFWLSALSLSWQGMFSHPLTIFNSLSCTHCNLSTYFS